MTTITSDPHPPPRSPVRLALATTLALLGCWDKQVAEGQDELGDASTDTSAATSDASSLGSESAGEDSSSDEGNPFVELPDGGATNTCDPAAQDCPEGEKCTGYVVEQGYCCVDANKCVPVIGDKQIGDPCTRSADNDDCDVGLFCMTKTSGSTGEGVCLAFCDAGTQDCGEDGLPDATCVSFNDGVLPLCQDDCDPLVQDCDGVLGCYGVGTQGFVCSLPGYDEGLGNDGDMCFTIQSCKPGLQCTATEVLDGCSAARCCSPFCDLGEADPCLAPEACVAYFDAGTAPPGYETVGLCVIPG
ncbi:hypothetical protein ACNOYE_24365 [Nannocystaceae bacterium ST9]